MLFWVGGILLAVVGILLGVAYFTLLERKILSFSQVRIGPSKVGGGGWVQPLVDGLKLLAKQPSLSTGIQLVWFLMVPIAFFSISGLGWFCMTASIGSHSNVVGIFMLMGVLGLFVYAVLLVGVFTLSKFSILGGFRAVAQSVSYEVMLSIFIIGVFSVWSSACVQGGSFVGLIISIPWAVCILAETNRAPLDFAEGESELISGFNVETGGFVFTLLFLGEYSVILFLLMVTSELFFSCVSFVYFVLMIIVINLVRSSFPRFRYDLLMGLCWVFFLPLGVVVFLFFTCISYNNLFSQQQLIIL